MGLSVNSVHLFYGNTVPFQSMELILFFFFLTSQMFLSYLSCFPFLCFFSHPFKPWLFSSLAPSAPPLLGFCCGLTLGCFWFFHGFS